MPGLVRFLGVVTTVAFLLLALSMIGGWMRRRTTAGGWLALSVALLSVVSLLSPIQRATGITIPAAGLLSVVGFLGSGYALLMFRASMIPLRPGWRLVAGATTAAAAVLYLAARVPNQAVRLNALQSAAVIALVVVWSALVGEPIVRFWIASRHRPAVQRARLRSLSVGFGALVAILLVAVGAGTALKDQPAQLGIEVVALLVVPLIYVSFAPPGWLRRQWRASEEALVSRSLHDLLSSNAPHGELAQHALDTAMRLVGAESGLIAAGDSSILATRGIDAERAPQMIEAARQVDEVRVLEQGSPLPDVLLVAPLSLAGGRGVLVLLPGALTPVFGGDELARVEQYATSVAAGLDRGTLLDELRTANTALFEGSPQPMWIVASDSLAFLAANDAAAALFGYTRDELLATTVLQMTPAEELPTVQRRARNPKPVARSGPWRQLRRDGTEIEVMVTSHLVTFGGRAARFVMGEDITEVRRLEAARVSAESQLRESMARVQAGDAERRRLLASLVTAQEEERRRIASDVHDDSLQVMAAVVIRLGMLRPLLTDARAITAIEKVEQDVQETILRLRHLLFQLRPPALDREGLAAALKQYMEQWTEEGTGLKYKVVSTLHQEPSSESRAILFRIAQEALTNVRKHARAGGVSVNLEDEKGGVMMRISDDGIGFSADAPSTTAVGHLGLISMRERAEIAGGHLQVVGHEGGGTSVECWIPALEPTDGERDDARD